MHARKPPNECSGVGLQAKQLENMNFGQIFKKMQLPVMLVRLPTKRRASPP